VLTLRRLARSLQCQVSTLSQRCPASSLVHPQDVAAALLPAKGAHRPSGSPLTLSHCLQVRVLEAQLAAQQAAWRHEALQHLWLRERATLLQLVRAAVYCTMAWW
jgi:hypothetical protein